MNVTRTFPLLVALLAMLPSAGRPASDDRLARSAGPLQVVAQLATDAPRSGHVFDPAPIAALLDKRVGGQVRPSNPKVAWTVAFRQQIRRCLKPPAARFAIDVDIRLNVDGTLAGEPLLVHPSDAVDHPEAAASVLRAIKACAPFRLPVDQYASWKTIATRFDGP
jgi:colicin import membrane protein